MRTEPEENQTEDLTLTQLRDELRDLAIRTRRLERQVHDIQHAGERAVPPRTTPRVSHGHITGSAETLQVGDRVRFRATKVTPGGTGRIIKVHQKASIRGVEINSFLDTYVLVMRGVMSQQLLKAKIINFLKT